MKCTYVLALMALEAILLCAGVAIASRNSSGTYTVPTTFVPGTTISSTTMNNQFQDIGAALTDSLSRSAQGGMTAALKGTDGTVAAPAFSFTNEPGSGLYRIGANDFGFAVGGIKKHEWTATGETVTGTLGVTGLGVTGLSTFADGVIGLPGISFGAENTSGFYRNAAADLRLSVTNTNVQRWGTTYSIFPTGTGLRLDGTTLTNNAGFWAGTPAGSPTTSNYFLAADGTATTTINAPTTVQFNIGGAAKATVTSGGLATSSGLTIGATGTAISASYRGTVVWNPGVMLTNTVATSTITVTGTVAGADCIAGVLDPAPLSGYPVQCITTLNTCNIAIRNQQNASFTFGSGTFWCRTFNP